MVPGEGTLMKVFNYTDIAAEPAEQGAHGTTVRWLITKEHGAQHFAMRYFEMEVGGYSPYHSHDWEHEVFILEGEGTITTESGPIPFQPGTVVFIPPNEQHQFKNTGSHPVKFLCLIPYKS
jgi:quercetin dioxygenase-like cupin family protein